MLSPTPRTEIPFSYFNSLLLANPSGRRLNSIRIIDQTLRYLVYLHNLTSNFINNNLRSSPIVDDAPK